MQRIVLLISPLTPALSPLRGEGVALDARRNPYGCRRVPSAAEFFGPNTQNAASAAMSVALTDAFTAPPSPLNGERAGVRGEYKRAAPFARKRHAPIRGRIPVLHHYWFGVTRR